MKDTKIGYQTIGCSVTSCRYNKEGTNCDLNRIEVKPMNNYDGSHSGDPAEESLCGSYCKI